MAAEKASKDSVRECNICGSALEESDEYCPECGADFTSQNKYNY
jgi:rubrerythrin